MSRPLTYSAHWLHADAFALGLGALSLTLFPKESDSAKWTAWIPAACCASLSVWSKQTMAPLFVALPLAVAILQGWRVAIRSVSALVVAGALISVLMFGIFGPGETWFNLVTIPSRHPWVADLTKDPRLVITGSDIGARLRVLGQSLGALLMESLIPLLMLAASLMVKRFLARGMKSSARDAHGRWITPLIVAVLMSSTAALGRVKVGGDVNALSYSVYFTALAAAASIAACFRAACSLDLPPVGRRVHQLILITMMAGMTVLWVQTAGQIREQAEKGPSPFDEAADLIRQSPGEVYFPWNPLAHLMAEGKSRHFYYGVYDRELAGFKLGEEHFNSHVPEKLRFIVFHAHADTSILARFPGFQRSVRRDEGTGLVFYESTRQQPAPGDK
ncbi:MAG TPA: hypothetical protein VK968_10965 [Roseimicrobium sp.]|nr:hypothetical protein [Roseimicrobium sp.]